MLQRHAIILWKKAESEDRNFEDFSKEAYDTLNIFQDYPQELRPNYLTVTSKKDIREFDWNYEQFYRVLKKGVNREGEAVFEELGYSISFFSSTDENASCAFLMSVGNKNDKFYNTFIIDLPLSWNLCDKNAADTIRSLFEKLVQTFKPFWGCISNKALPRTCGKFLEGTMPMTIHWINYWSEDIVRTVGMERIQELVAFSPAISFHKGILSVKDTAFDAKNEEDIQLYDALQNYLFMEGTLNKILF